MNHCIGVILAGGQARRLNGADKGLLEIGGKTMLERLIDRLAPQCAALAVNANGDLKRFDPFRLPVVADSVSGFAGPLAGVLAGMDYAASQFPQATHIVTVPVDTAFIPSDLVAKLEAARISNEADIAVASSAAHMHFAVALWPLDLREKLRFDLTEAKTRRVSAFIERHRFAVAMWRADPYDPFFNVNTTDDVAKAEAIAQRAQQMASV